MTEEALRFGSPHTLVGILSSPAASSRDTANTGVIFLNAGLLHRIGPNRLFVSLARRLAELGLPSLRFDHSGIGDSPNRGDKMPYDKARVAETREAMDLLARESGCTRFYVVGLCSGTLTAFRTACSDSRIVGLIFLNALLENPSTIDEGLAKKVVNRKIARSYWTNKIFRLDSWSRLVRNGLRLGKVARVTGSAAISTLRGPTKLPAGVIRVIDDLKGLSAKGITIRFVFGGRTTFLEYFRLTLQNEMLALSRRGTVSVEVLKDGDHNFNQVRHQESILRLVERWIVDRTASPNPETKDPPQRTRIDEQA